MTKRDDEEELDLDLDLDLEFEEHVGEPRPMSVPPGEDPAATADDDAEDVLEIAGDMLADTGEELLESLTDAGDDPPVDEALVELESAAIELTGMDPVELDEPADASPVVSVFTGAAALGAAGAVGEPGLVSEPSAATTATPTQGADDSGLEGQWVWQFAAPPPPAPFSAVFFSGRALPELYWFFASGVLVLLGCLLPWGPSLAWVVERGESTLGYTSPPAGYELPGGALCLAAAVWLLAAASYGIYTGRQKILPVFMMLLPAWLSWSRTLGAWSELGGVDDLGFKEQLVRLFEVAGTGVLLTMVGSTIVAAQLLFVILKVMKKQPPADGARARKGGEKKPAKESDKAKASDKSKQKRGKDKKDKKSKKKGKSDAGGDAATADAGGDAAAASGEDASAGSKSGRGARGKRGRGR